MDENPYKVLNVKPNASEAEIKKAYRRLALLHHPDRKTSPEEKEKSAQIFQKVGNAYEILGDKDRRALYDQHGSVAQSTQTRYQDPFMRGFGGFGSFGSFGRGFFNDSERFHTSDFTDPFDLFHQVFRQNLDSDHVDHLSGFTRNRRSQRSSAHASDDFGFGQGIEQIMARHMNMMNMMDNESPFQSNSLNPRNMESSSFQSGGGNYHRSGVSTSTKTTIVNGKRRTITEKIIYNPDGTVERKVETNGDEDFPSIEQNQNRTFIEGERRRGSSRRGG